MKHHAIKVKNNQYSLNNYQWFVVDKPEIKKRLSEIKFPALVLDTEFFNQSHNRTKIPNPLYNEKNPSLVYVLQYSFVNSLKEVYLRSNRKAIKNLTMKRKPNDPKYNFQTQYEAMIRSFLQMCLHKKIQTIIVAGDSNDKAIIKNWINNHKKLLGKQTSQVFKKTETGDYDLEIFDIYSVLEKTMAFSNFHADGSTFSKPKQLKKGYFGPQTVQIPSLKWFFDYFSTLYETERFEDNANIYELCVNALKFFSFKTLEPYQFIVLNRNVREAKKHCFNDVLKILYLLKFWYSLTEISDEKNKYIRVSKDKK